MHQLQEHCNCRTHVFFPMDAMKKMCLGLPSARGRRHNSQGLNLFFLRMLLGASQVQQRGRLQDRRQSERMREAHSSFNITRLELLSYY